MINNEIKNSLLFKVLVYLIIIVITIQMLSSLFIIFQKNKKDFDTYKKNKEKVVNELSKNIVYNLWNFDFKEAKNTIITKFNNNEKSFVGIIIYEKESNKLLFGFEQIDSQISEVEKINTKGYEMVTIDLKYNDTVYWYAVLYFSNTYLYRDLRKNIIETSITTLLLIVFVSFSLTFILNRFVIVPINELINNSIKITKGNYSLVIPDSDIKEIDLLSQNYEIMAKAIKKRENDLQNVIKEKEMLLQEIHHRVKNNMLFLYGIFDIQQEYIKEFKIKNFLEEAKNRIKSISLVHSMIYKSDNMALLNFSKFIKIFCNELIEIFYDESKKISITYKLDPVYLNISQSITCGIIINELVTNSIRHAFVNVNNGKIWIELNKKNDKITLVIGDNGKGLSKNFNITKSKSLGLRLILMLVKQLKADLSIKKEGGTIFVLNFYLGN